MGKMSILQNWRNDQNEIVLNDPFTNAYFWVLSKIKNMTKNEMVLPDPYNAPK